MSEEQNNQGYEWCQTYDWDADGIATPSPIKTKKKILTPEQYAKYCEEKPSSVAVSTPPEIALKSSEARATPTSSKSGQGPSVKGKRLNIKGKRLDFEETVQASTPGNERRTITTAVLCCNGTNVEVEVRDIDRSDSFKKDPKTEIEDIMNDDVPLEAQKYILKRRASVLPYKCSNCSKWCPPLYRCTHCGVLMWGIHISDHEMNCQNSV